jgi:hypothetical protein
MALTTAIRSRLARHAPGLEERVSLTAWRFRNRDRSLPADVPPRLAALLERLHTDGVVVTDVETLLGDRELYEAAEREALRLYEAPRPESQSDRGKAFLTKLAQGSFPVEHPFAQVALHPALLAVANGYLRMRSTLRALELWLTQPTEGPAVETQLWHRDADDVMNLKLFLYFNEVTTAAGPFVYAPTTQPGGRRREVPEHDERWRSTDEQIAAVVPESEWVVCEGHPGTVVLADTCGYHKQLKPESAERLLLTAQYVSGTPFVPRAVEIQGAEGTTLSDDQRVAVFDRAE